jgi:DHA1 family tetracycline resistance protein-like MFS transporter
VSAEPETPLIKPPRAGAVVFIFITILLDMFALGLIMPVLPKLVESFVENDTASAARYFGLFGTAWALMQFFFSPVLGGLSDRFGRRPVVLLSNLGLALDYVLMALAPSLIWLFIGRVISGITSASISTAFAYIADVTPPERRAAVFGKVGVAFGAGFILGPALGGLLGGMDPRLPFWVAAGLSFANALYGLLILPESLPKQRRSTFRWRSANPVGALKLLRSNRVLAGLSVVTFIGQVAHVVLPSSCFTRPIAMAGMRRQLVSRWRWSAFVQWWCRAPRSGPSSRVSASAGRCCSEFAAAPSASLFLVRRRPGRCSGLAFR